jgi:hypothetical protein
MRTKRRIGTSRIEPDQPAPAEDGYLFKGAVSYRLRSRRSHVFQAPRPSPPSFQPLLFFIRADGRTIPKACQTGRSVRMHSQAHQVSLFCFITLKLKRIARSTISADNVDENSFPTRLSPANALSLPHLP